MNVIGRPALCGLLVALVVTSACDLVSSPEDSRAIRELRAVFGEDLEHEDALKFASLTSELKAAFDCPGRSRWARVGAGLLEGNAGGSPADWSSRDAGGYGAVSGVGQRAKNGLCFSKVTLMAGRGGGMTARLQGMHVSAALAQ